ncbi:polysaccharide biosynthesis C-terminal domain-containing protein [Bacteroides heparinolyticus]|uniref:oligosaccharide flippase family protein n=1 Tax=Prevotella heparinolytica TaxID=28113 RepID=UPI0023F2CE35|nr:polysaccharide biosynthesis C-terminal domain-containing protein [Bacteroides heparinolyticus]
MNKYKYLLENVVVFALGSVLSKVVLFFLLAVFTKYLTSQEYGDAELIISTISLLIPILTFCISDASLRFLFGNDRKESIITNSIVVTSWGLVIILIISPIFYRIDSLANYIPYIIALYLFNSFEVLLFNINKGLEKVRLCSLNSIVSVLTLSVCSYITIVLLKLGVYGYLISIIISHLFSCLYLLIFGKLYQYISFKDIDARIIKGMLIYSVPFVPSTIAWWINSLSDRYLIVFLLGSSFNGLYSAAAKIPNIISIFTTIFHQAWQLSGIKEYNDQSYVRFYSNIYNIFSACIVSFSALLILFLPIIGSWLFKGEFIEAWKYVHFLVFGAIFSGLSGVLAPAYMATKKTSLLMVSTLVGSVVNIIINILLLRVWGLQIASISTFISFLFVWLIRLVMIRKIIDISVDYLPLFVSIILLIIATIISHRFEELYALIEVALCVGVCIVNVFSVKPQILQVYSTFKNRKG